MEDEGKLGIIMEYQGRTGKTGKNMEDNGKRRKGLLSAVTPAGCKPGSTGVSTNDNGFPLTAAGMSALSPRQVFRAQSLEPRASFAVSLNQIGVRHLFNKRLLGAVFFAGLLVYLSTAFVAAACCTTDADCAPSYHYCVLGNCYSCKYDSDCPDPFNRFCTHGYCTSSYCRDSSGICVTSDGTGYPSDCCDQIDTSGNFPGGSWRGSGCAAPGCHPWVPPICSAPPPSACTGASGFDALVRASRRGQRSTNFNASGAPGGNRWGEAYDTDNNASNFGSWGGIASLALKNSQSAPANSHTGHPAPQLYPTSSFIQVGDPTSALGLVTGWMTTDFHYTSSITVNGIFGPQNLQVGGSGPSSDWPITIVAGPYQTPATLTVPFTSLQAGSSWTLLPSAPALTTPPQPCTGGACDTEAPSLETFPHPPASLADMDYGVYPDSQTPYAVLNSQSPWGIVTGTVRESGTGRLLSGIPVRISPGAIEKITDTSGNFKILAPANGPLNVTVNDPRPAAPNSPNTHFFDPSHAATTVNNLSANTAPWNMSNPGATNVLTPPLDITLDSLSATTNSGGNASISGALKSAENTTVPLPGLMVGLREGQGRLIQVVQSTGAAGAYTFSNLPAGEFYVLPVLPRNQAAVPMQIPVSLIWGQSLGVPAFLISGVPATIQVNAGKPGVFVLVAQTGALPGGGTPPIYDARAPGQAYYTKVSGDNGIATLLVPPGQSYALKCWKPNPQGGYDYISSPPTGPVPGGTLNALQIYPVSCP